MFYMRINLKPVHFDSEADIAEFRSFTPNLHVRSCTSMFTRLLITNYTIVVVKYLDVSQTCCFSAVSGEMGLPV